MGPVKTVFKHVTRDTLDIEIMKLVIILFVNFEKCKKPKEVHKQNSLLSFVKVENISKLLQSG